MAAVLAAGPGAILSHRSAAALHALLAAYFGPVHVTVPRALRPRRGLVFHHSLLPNDEIEVIDGIPVTGLSRTIFDLAAQGTQAEVARALHEAEVKGLTDALPLDALLARYPRRRGTARVRMVLADRRWGAAATRSDLEERFLTFVTEQGLPRPEINTQIRVADTLFEVDAVWRDAHLVVELDGRATHLTRRAFERDRARDRALQTDGWKVIRITWRQLHEEPAALAADLRILLGAAPESASRPRRV